MTFENNKGKLNDNDILNTSTETKDFYVILRSLVALKDSWLI